jgi:serine/threonine protein kinase
MADLVGQRLGNYQLQRLIGKGGFAEVYLGEHLRLHTQAAIKVLHTRLASEEEIASFQQEAQTIAKLVHPHIVRVLDFDVQDDTPFLVMDYAAHGTLRQKHPRGTRLAVESILPYVTQAAEALQYAHEQKLIHRDIKPENLLLNENNAILLSDFGIALVAQSSRYQNTQEIIGTMAYMAPEQLQGYPRPASDQYALAITVYEWLTGDRPFQGSYSELFSQQMFVAPTPLRAKAPELAPAIEEVVLTALAKDPKERFGSVRAFATAFEQACQGAALHFAPTQVIRPAGLVARPTAALPSGIPPATGNITVSNVPPTAFMAPSQAPETPANAVAMPPRWKHTPDTTFPTTSDTFTGSQLASPFPGTSSSAAPAKTIRQSKRRVRRSRIIVGSLIIVLLLATGGGIGAAVLYNTLKFHQTIIMDSAITSIQVGTGYSGDSSVIGATDTVHSGDTVYLVFTFDTSHGDTSPLLITRLFLLPDNTLKYESPNPLVGGGTYVDATSVSAPGIYKWEVEYDTYPAASITFQVLSKTG